MEKNNLTHKIIGLVMKEIKPKIDENFYSTNSAEISKFLDSVERFVDTVLNYKK